MVCWRLTEKAQQIGGRIRIKSAHWPLEELHAKVNDPLGLPQLEKVELFALARTEQHIGRKHALQTHQQQHGHRASRRHGRVHGARSAQLGHVGVRWRVIQQPEQHLRPQFQTGRVNGADTLARWCTSLLLRHVCAWHASVCMGNIQGHSWRLCKLEGAMAAFADRRWQACCPPALQHHSPRQFLQGKGGMTCGRGASWHACCVGQARPSWQTCSASCFSISVGMAAGRQAGRRAFEKEAYSQLNFMASSMPQRQDVQI
eukprot:967644-Pelagomonas_calceolata.AAC.2